MLNKIDKGIYRACAAVGSLSYVGIIAMMVLNLIDVFLTKFFGINVQGAYELTERLLMCMVDLRHLDPDFRVHPDQHHHRRAEDSPVSLLCLCLCVHDLYDYRSGLAYDSGVPGHRQR